MGIFNKFFEKKECAICGEEIKLLGNRKLEDGNICKNCAAKLSPWFSERRQSTVTEIKAQLAYREANKEKVEAFHITRTLGETIKVLLDEDAGRFMITSARQYKEVNPDVLAFSDVTGCIVDIDESCTELEHVDDDGNHISYNPARYIYRYDFYIVIHVNHPYFDEMRFRVNKDTVEVETHSPHGGGNHNLEGLLEMSIISVSPTQSPEYQNYKALSEEIKEAVLGVRQKVRENVQARIEQEAALQTPWVCPACGGQNTGGKFCEYCGNPRV